VGTAAIFIVIGFILMAVGFFSGADTSVIFSDGAFYRINDVAFEYDSAQELEHAIKNVNEINIDVSNAAIYIEQSDDDSYGLHVSYVQVGEKPKVTMEDGMIQVLENEKDNDFHITFFWNLWKIVLNQNDNKIVLSVPKDAQMDSIQIHTSNGIIESYADYQVNTFIVKSSNGKIDTDHLTVLQNTDIRTSNGAMDIRGTFSKNFYAKTSNGKIQASGVFHADVTCETSNGAVEMNVENAVDDYELEARTSNGKIVIDGDSYGNEYHSRQSALYKMYLKCSNGKVEANFGEKGKQQDFYSMSNNYTK